MLGFKKSLIPAAVGASLLLAACGSSSNTSSSSAPASSTAHHASPASASPSNLTLTTAKGSMGSYLVGASGRALYLWVADSGGMSNCSAQCAKVWPPLTVSAKPHVAGGVNASDISLITRSDGTKQVTYKGHPLYYFVADPTAGTIKGQGSNSFGAKWWLVAPSGNAITLGTTTSGSSGSSSSGSSGGSYPSGSSGGSHSSGSSAGASSSGASSSGGSAGGGWG